MKQPAPALDRGLAVLHLLCEEGELNLETISTLTQIPKASALRLLETLEKNSCIYRDVETKKYRALKQLVGADSEFDDFSKLRKRLLKHLADSRKVTAEWFEVFDEGTRLVYRQEPEDYLVKVAARVGFVRAFVGSFEAVTQIALANNQEAFDVEGQYYNMNWDQKLELEPEFLESVIANVKESSEAKDVHWNPNGVRRIAVGVFGPKSDLLGIMSLAFSYDEDFAANEAGALKELRDCKAQLESLARKMRFMK